MADYIDSYYRDTLKEQFTACAFQSSASADVCIVGGGIAALSCAQALLDSGRSVSILEANKVFFGASGRNGGFVSPGYSLSMDGIQRRVGADSARALFQLTVAGVDRIRRNIGEYGIHSAALNHGKISLLRYRPKPADVSQHLQRMRDVLHYPVETVEKADLRDLLSTDTYHFGFLDRNAFHIHPLNYGVALARVLASKGVRIHEGQKVQSILPRGDGYVVTSTSGETLAGAVVICTGGYSSGESAALARCILPITTYVAASEPGNTAVGRSIRTNYALGDNRRASDYYRLVGSGQLLWGGRITAFPRKDEQRIRRYIGADVASVFPDLSSLALGRAWSGTMGYSLHKMPYLGRFENGVWYCTAFGGHGLGSGTAGGVAVARAVLGDTSQVNLFRQFPLRSAYGILGRIGVELTYKKYIIGDHIREAVRQ